MAASHPRVGQGSQAPGPVPTCPCNRAEQRQLCIYWIHSLPICIQVGLWGQRSGYLRFATCTPSPHQCPVPKTINCTDHWRSVSFPVLYGYGGGDEADRPELLAFLLVGLRAMLVLVWLSGRGRAVRMNALICLM